MDKTNNTFLASLLHSTVYNAHTPFSLINLTSDKLYGLTTIDFVWNTLEKCIGLNCNICNTHTNTQVYLRTWNCWDPWDFSYLPEPYLTYILIPVVTDLPIFTDLHYSSSVLVYCRFSQSYMNWISISVTLNTGRATSGPWWVSGSKSIV